MRYDIARTINELLYTTTWINLTNTIVSKRSQMQKVHTFVWFQIYKEFLKKAKLVAGDKHSNVLFLGQQLFFFVVILWAMCLEQKFIL